MSTAASLLPRRLLNLDLVGLTNRRRRQTQPTASLVRVTETEAPIAIHGARRKWAGGTLADGRASRRHAKIGVAAMALLDQLARDNTKHFVDTLSIFGADLMTAVPADLLAPEGAAPFAIWAL